MSFERFCILVVEFQIGAATILLCGFTLGRIVQGILGYKQLGKRVYCYIIDRENRERIDRQVKDRDEAKINTKSAQDIP